MLCHILDRSLIHIGGHDTMQTKPAIKNLFLILLTIAAVVAITCLFSALTSEANAQPIDPDTPHITIKPLTNQLFYFSSLGDKLFNFLSENMPELQLYSLIIILYLLPAIIACMRRHPDAHIIGVINILFGWAIIIYCLIFIMAVWRINPRYQSA